MEEVMSITNDIHDLCERLVIVQSWLNITHERQTIAEAKDTIERLAAENKRLRGALEKVAAYYGPNHRITEIAQAVLKGEET